MFKRLTTAATVFGMAALAPPAFGETTTARAPCAARDVVVEQLAARYKETRIGAGLQSEQAIFELWTSEDSGSWTITRTGINGLTCVMASGQAWTDVELKKGVGS